MLEMPCASHIARCAHAKKKLVGRCRRYLSEGRECPWIGVGSLLIPVLSLQEAKALACVCVHGAKVSLRHKPPWRKMQDDVQYAT